MKRRKPRRARRAPPEVPPGEEGVVARPDGYYWLADGGRQEFGPYPTAAQAAAAAREAIEAVVEDAQRLQQVEAEIGVAERVDHDIVEVDERTDDSRQP
jgi:hypothetical protein